MRLVLVRQSAFTQSAIFSAVINTVKCVFAHGIVGKIEASPTRTPSTPTPFPSHLPPPPDPPKPPSCKSCRHGGPPAHASSRTAATLRHRAPAPPRPGYPSPTQRAARP